MGLLDVNRFKGSQNDVWRADIAGGGPPEFDFSANQFCGINLGDPVSVLWRLGKPEQTGEGNDGVFECHSRGFEVDGPDGVVEAFAFFLTSTASPPFEEFRGIFRYRGQPVAIPGGTKEAKIIELFGAPYWRDEDDGGILLFYEFNGVEWQMEIDREEGLNVIVVLRTPLLADPRARDQYKVNVSWPPQCRAG